MLYAVLKLLHLLCVIAWVGGMVFMHFFLRPALNELDPPAKARLMERVLSRFLNAVLLFSSLAVLSGGWMVGNVARKTVQAGAPFNMPLEWMAMAALGLLMWMVFGHIRFALFKRFVRAVAGLDWSAASLALVRIRRWMLFNLGVGLVVIACTVVGGAS